MKFKRQIAAVLAVIMAVSVAGCSDNNTSTDSGDASSDGAATTSGETSDPGATPTSDFVFGQVAMGGAGFVSGVFATKEEGLYYARTDVGGAYRFDKETDRWVSLSYGISEDDRGLLGVEALAFSDNNPAKLYLLCGTEYFSGGKGCLLISEDYGETFETVDLTGTIKVHGNGMGRGNGERMAVDPKNDNIIYIGGRTGGIIKSTDGGKTFTTLDMGTETSTENQNGICSIIIDPESGDENGCTTIYAAISRIQQDNLYKSTDGGNTWAPVADAPKSVMVQRMKYSNGKIFITYANTEGPWNNDAKTGSVRSLDIATDTMTEISPKKKGYGDIVIDPTNPDRMVICTENTYSQQPNGTWGDEFFVTTDGGANWTYLNEVMKMSDGGVPWLKTASMHWCSSMAIDPNNPNRIMVVSGNGIFACDNIWDANPEFYFDAKGIEEAVPSELVSIKGGKLVTTIYDYDGFSQDDPKEFGKVHSSTAGSMVSLAVAAQNPDVWVKAGGDSKTHGFWYTLDGGESWVNVKKSPMEGRVGYAGCVAVSCDGKTFFWAPEGANKTFYTTDLGETWVECEGCPPGTKRITCDLVNPNYAYLTSDSYFCYTEDGGKTWKNNMSLSIFKSTRPIVTPDIEGKVYLAAMGLQVSTDHGQTFTRLDSVAICDAVGLGKGKTDSDPYTIFIWGKPTKDDPQGIYWSQDEGKTWERVNDDAHQFGGPGNGYFIYGDFNVYGRVYMSTVGLGVVYGDLKSE